MKKDITNVDRYKRIVKLQDKAFAENNLVAFAEYSEQLTFLWDEMTAGEQNKIVKFLEAKL